MKNEELKPLGGFEKSIDVPAWLAFIVIVGGLLLASIPVKG